MIEDKTIAKLERLAMLSLSEEEKQSLKPELEKMLAMVGKLSELDTKDILPLRNINPHMQELRSDKPLGSLTQENALSNAQRKRDYYVVPKVVKK